MVLGLDTLDVKLPKLTARLLTSTAPHAQTFHELPPTNVSNTAIDDADIVDKGLYLTRQLLFNQPFY